MMQMMTTTQDTMMTLTEVVMTAHRVSVQDVVSVATIVQYKRGESEDEQVISGYFN